MNRAEAIMAAVQLAHDEMLPGDEAEIIVCAGPPLCHLTAPGACEAAWKQGCPHCTLIKVGEELARA